MINIHIFRYFFICIIINIHKSHKLFPIFIEMRNQSNYDNSDATLKDKLIS